MAQRERIELDARELGTVLAALRFYQSANDSAIPTSIHAIASGDDELEPLDNNEIDALCERINV